MILESFPLAWPVGRPRTPSARRRRAPFHRRVPGGTTGWKRKADLTLHQGVVSAQDELRRLGASGVVITTNVPTRQDGLPYSSAREPDDPGVAVYFRLSGAVHCLACDRWDRVADNLAAVAHHVAAMRGQSRWGVGSVEQAFAGYRALPAAAAKRPWWELLGFSQLPARLEIARDAWREWIFKAHPDRGGTANQAAEINAAMAEAERYFTEEGST